jgi:hypothetical protein
LVRLQTPVVKTLVVVARQDVALFLNGDIVMQILV